MYNEGEPPWGLDYDSWYIYWCLKGSRFPQDTPPYNNSNTKHQGMCIRLNAFRKIWNVDRNGNIVMNAHTCLDMDADSDTVQKHHWIDFTLLDCEQEIK